MKKLRKLWCSIFGHSYHIAMNAEEMWAICYCCRSEKDIPKEKEEQAYRQIRLGIWNWKE
jgi:hypothetical protein